MPSDNRLPGIRIDLENMIREHVQRALQQAPMESAWKVRKDGIGHMKKLLSNKQDFMNLSKQINQFWSDDEDGDMMQNHLADHIQQFVQSVLQRSYQAAESLTDQDQTDSSRRRQTRESNDSRRSVPVEFSSEDQQSHNQDATRSMRRVAKRRYRTNKPILFSVPRKRQ